MNELLLKRIERRLANLEDAQGYEVLDYVEFLETKYGIGERKPGVLERVAEGVEDALRAVRAPAAAIRGTVGAVDTAGKMMNKLAEAGKAAMTELNRAGRSVSGEGAAAPAPASAPAPDAAAPEPPAEEPPASA